MDFELFKLFFGTYLESYLARECNTQQTCKWQELAGKITSLQDCKVHDHMITLFESMTETNSVSNGLKKYHLNRHLDLYVMLLYLRPICTNRKRYAWISDKSCTHISPGPGCVKWIYQIRLHLFIKFRF